MPALFGWCRKMAKYDVDEANDILQETLIKAYRFWDTFEQGTNLKAWLYQIAKHAFLDRQHEKQRRMSKVTDSYSQHENSFENEPSMAVHQESGEEMFGDEISAAMSKIPAIFRDIMILSDIEHVPHYEIAAQFGIPEGTVKSRLHRGRDRLEKLLTEYAATRGYTPQGRRTGPIRKEKNRRLRQTA